MSKSWEAKEDEKERARQEFRREQQEHDRKRAEYRRGLCNVLNFSRFCAEARCKRARRCAGNVDACFAYFWPHVPQDSKNEIRRAMELAAAGMAPAEAVREAKAYVEQRRRIGEEMARRQAARAAATPAEPAPEAASVPATRTHAPARVSGPRIRTL